MDLKLGDIVRIRPVLEKYAAVRKEPQVSMTSLPTSPDVGAYVGSCGFVSALRGPCWCDVTLLDQSVHLGEYHKDELSVIMSGLEWVKEKTGEVWVPDFQQEYYYITPNLCVERRFLIRDWCDEMIVMRGNVFPTFELAAEVCKKLLAQVWEKW